MDMGLIEKIGDIVKKSISNPTIYLERATELSTEQEELVISEGVIALQDTMIENQIDYFYEMEIEAIKEAIKENSDAILKITNKDINISNLSRDLYEQGLVSCEFSITDFLAHYEILGYIEFYSNYDCINSHYFEGSYSYEESYFGDMVDLLNLDPATLKEYMESKGIETLGEYPSKESRLGKEWVEYDMFIEELVNSISPANTLVFPVEISLHDMAWEKSAPVDVIKIPKGSRIGLFSSAYGGGSSLECPLKKDIEIKLGSIKKLGDRETPDYTSFGFVVDGKGGYGISETYGVDSTFFPAVEVILKEDTDENNIIA